MTNTTRAVAAAAAMDPQIRAQALRAARGARPASAAAVPMGIRYRNPPATGRPAPAEPRPRWAVLAASALLGEVTEPAPRAATSRRRRAGAAPAVTVAMATVTMTHRDVDRPVLPSSHHPAPASTGTTSAVPQRVLRRFDAHACESCGNRYRFNDPDHQCGPLTPVTVTVTAGTTTTAAAQVGVLGSYDAHACEACGHRYGQQLPDHPCGPLTPVTVTIAVRAAGGPA